MISIKLHLSKTFACVVFTAVFFWGGQYLFCVLISAFIHECAHLACALRLKLTPKKLKLSVFGFCLETDYIFCFSKKVAVSCAGPAINLALYFFCLGIKSLADIDGLYLDIFALVNLTLAVVNLVPIAPLDGGAILKACLARRLGIIRGGKVFRTISALFCVFFCAFTLAVHMAGIFNPYLLLLCLFLIIGIKREAAISLSEKNLVLSGLVPRARKKKFLCCDYLSELICLAQYINEDRDLSVLVYKGENLYGYITQSDILNSIKTKGALCSAKECCDSQIHLNRSNAPAKLA